MIRALPHQDPRCTRIDCGCNLYSIRDTMGLRIIHPYFPGNWHCVDEGRVFRRDLTFAGWWITRQEFVEGYQ